MEHSNHDAHGSGYHGSVKSYLIGFVLSVILTVVPFGMVMVGGFDPKLIFWSISLLAVVQIIVHLKYFLHLDFSVEGRPNTFTFLFTGLVIVMVVGLSLWIIYASNDMMM
ncbi:Cytochrome O ubiquinol oxidase subunit IV [Marinobacterium lacunae]|uniref:Cytochrome bo(3) ubiquinol oxidase subunit 4 n=1 Tax=Marinobacterium lacunae TaxID=1232683 RepID=A0A081G1J4_9GAMM|nr:cytochrome o ubiquinol oxidase subunit IV [Marinobacterium lacunae]KEA64649.1 Cytochrome O ubiquinol oxidase subunit IV [Marinobacterium lacunae]